MARFDDEDRRLLVEAIDRWGSDRQLIKCGEECAELVQAICKRFNGGGDAFDVEAVVEEIAGKQSRRCRFRQARPARAHLPDASPALPAARFAWTPVRMWRS